MIWSPSHVEVHVARKPPIDDEESTLRLALNCLSVMLPRSTFCYSYFLSNVALQQCIIVNTSSVFPSMPNISYLQFINLVLVQTTLTKSLLPQNQKLRFRANEKHPSIQNQLKLKTSLQLFCQDFWFLAQPPTLSYQVIISYIMLLARMVPS
jgi:hypothetical protein